MTQEELKSVYSINKEIEMWERELDNLRQQSLMSTGEITGMPFANTNEVHSPAEDLAIKMVECEKLIAGRKKELQKRRLKIIHYIFGIEDPLTRMIVKYRCVDCLSWEQISDYLGFERTTCAKRFKAFMGTLPER